VLRLITLGRMQLLRDGASSEAIHLQPKRLALLSFLALAASDGVQHRDTLLALFWPHADQNRARRCLRQALFHLRNELGDGVLVNAGREGVALAPSRLWCDAVALEEALIGRRRREAMQLYAGDFLSGLFVDDCAPELEEWVEWNRQRLRARTIAGAWELVEEELRANRQESALETARRARSLSPDDEHGLRRHMVVLARVGDTAAALNAYAEFTKRLRQQYDAEPCRESKELAGILRQGHLPVEASGVVPTHPSASAGSDATGRMAPHRRRGRRRTDTIAWASQITLSAVLILAGFALGRPRAPRLTPPVGGHVLLTQFTNHTHDSLLAAAVTEALRADLSQIAEVRLTSTQASRLSSADTALRDTALAIVGDVAALGPGFTVSARVVSPGSGRVLAVLREDAADSNLLLRTVERLSRRLRGNVIESLAPSAAPSFRERIAAWVGRPRL
jgi:DNA-binding SARP family transcriptional activator